MDEADYPEMVRRWLACWRTLTVRRVTLKHIGCGVYQALRQRDRVFEQMYHKDRWSAEAMVESWIRSGETREPALAARQRVVDAERTLVDWLVTANSRTGQEGRGDGE